jgi:hypothetical protein
MDLSLRGYIWTKEQIESYKRLKRLEDFELMGDVTGGVKAAMDALGDELLKYLREAGEEMEKKKEKKVPQKTLVERLFGDFLPQKPKKKPTPPKPSFGEDKEMKGKAVAHNGLNLWITYNNFKKAHGLINW